MEKTSKYQKNSTKYSYEDLLFKQSMETFGETALAFLGIKGEIKNIIPTELIILPPQNLRMDYVFEMMDTRLIHLEFQSSNGGVDDLRRFRLYDARLSYQLKKEITTFVIFTGNILDPMHCIEHGHNRYSIQAVTMADKNGDSIFERLRHKIEEKVPLTKEDAVELAFSPLMGGEMSTVDKIAMAIDLTLSPNFDKIFQEDTQKILTALASKFLEEDEFDTIGRRLKMINIIERFIDEGRQEGVREGRQEGVQEGRQAGVQEGRQEGVHLVAKNLIGDLPNEVIAEKTGLSLEEVTALALEKKSKAS